MKTLIKLKCPACEANLSVEEGREITFCQYCGTKILVNDENKYTYRHIDDADIRRAETERMVKLKKLELEEKRQAARRKLLVGCIAIAAVLFLVGIIMIATGPKDSENPGYFAIMLGMLVVGLGVLGALQTSDK